MYQRIENASDLPEDEHLSSEEILELHNCLVDLASELVANSIRAMNALTENQEMDPDELDAAISESNRELSLRFADRERRMLKKIQHSLERIFEGEYGCCEECDVPIGIRRLRFRPVACLCIDCKTQQEQLERNSWSM
jgi:DnaK suppressor protein